MSKNAQKQLPRIIDDPCIFGHGFGDGLINRFIEPDQIVYASICLSADSIRATVSEHWRERPVLRYHLIDIETVVKTKHCVQFGCAER
jgi:hypothetical protein